MGRSTWRLVLGYGALAALLLGCLWLVSLAPLRLDWGRELVAAVIAIVGVVVGLRFAQRHDAARASRGADGAVAPGGNVLAGRAATGPAGDGATGMPASQGAVGAPVDAQSVAAALSPRERGVLELLARGLSNKQIARELHVSENTVKTHLGNVYAKLGASRRTEALAKARRHGVIA